MKHGEYCITVCGGKCCRMYSEGKEVYRCPNQLESGACGIYDEWKDKDTCGFVDPKIENIPMTIEQAIAGKYLDPEVIKGCCYAHEELLQIGDKR